MTACFYRSLVGWPALISLLPALMRASFRQLWPPAAVPFAHTSTYTTCPLRAFVAALQIALLQDFTFLIFGQRYFGKRAGGRQAKEEEELFCFRRTL